MLIAVRKRQDGQQLGSGIVVEGMNQLTLCLDVDCIYIVQSVFKIMQKQEQIEKVKTVPQGTFEDICPDWNKIISDEGGFANVDVNKTYGKEKNIQHYGCCIVGSAHDPIGND